MTKNETRTVPWSSAALKKWRKITCSCLQSSPRFLTEKWFHNQPRGLLLIWAIFWHMKMLGLRQIFELKIFFGQNWHFLVVVVVVGQSVCLERPIPLWKKIAPCCCFLLQIFLFFNHRYDVFLDFIFHEGQGSCSCSVWEHASHTESHIRQSSLCRFCVLALHYS